MPTCLDERISSWQRIMELLDKKIARVILVVVLGAMGSIPLVLLTPPFQVPDEVQHFYRAYQLSEFHIRAEVQDGIAGGTLPESLPLLVKSSVYTPDGIYYPPTPAPLAKTLRLTSIPLNPSSRRFVGFPGSAFYSPLPYLPAVVGIGIGRMMGLGPFYLLYLGRLCNCLSALALIGLAVYAIPAGEEFLAIAGLLPMALYLYASLSADAAVIPCALLFCALAFRATTRGEWKTWELWVAALAGAVFCSVKPVYAPILLAGVIPGIFQRKNVTRVIRAHLFVLTIALGVTAGWLLLAKSTLTAPLSGAQPSAQISLVLHHPMVLVRAIANTMGLTCVLAFYMEAVGVFGWLTVWLWPPALLLPIVNCLVVCGLGLGSKVQRSARHAMWYVALALATGALVFATIYVMWAHVGQAIVLGMQGRYFIPIFGLLAMAATVLVPARRVAQSQWKGLAITAGIVIVQIVAMDATIIHTFQVF